MSITFRCFAIYVVRLFHARRGRTCCGYRSVVSVCLQLFASLIAGGAASDYAAWYARHATVNRCYATWYPYAHTSYNITIPFEPIEANARERYRNGYRGDHNRFFTHCGRGALS